MDPLARFAQYAAASITEVPGVGCGTTVRMLASDAPLVEKRQELARLEHAKYHLGPCVARRQRVLETAIVVVPGRIVPSNPTHPPRRGARCLA